MIKSCLYLLLVCCHLVLPLGISGNEVSLLVVSSLTTTAVDSDTKIVESSHPYDNNHNYFSSQITFGSGPRIYSISFDSQTETATNDRVNIRDGGNSGVVLYYKEGDNFPPTITIESSNGITIELDTDSSTTAWGLLATIDDGGSATASP